MGIAPVAQPQARSSPYRQAAAPELSAAQAGPDGAFAPFEQTGLVQALGDSDARVRRGTCELIGSLGPAAVNEPGVRRALKRRAKDRDPLVSRAARAALEKATIATTPGVTAPTSK